MLCGCCPQRTVLGLCIFASSARVRLASLRFSRACVECPRPENVHVWEASARLYESRERPRGRTGRSSNFARWLTSTRMVSGATWCAAARSRAATAGRHTRNRTSHSKMAPLRGVGARMRAGLRASNRRARHLPMRYETGLPSSVIRFRTLPASTASRRCPDELRARRPSPTIDLYRKNAFSTRAC